MMRQWDGDNALVLMHLLQFFDIRAKDDNGRNTLHYGAIHGAFNRKLTEFLRDADIFNLLNEKDFRGKAPLNYAEEEARRKRYPNLFMGSWWQELLRNLKNLKEGQEFTLQQ